MKNKGDIEKEFIQIIEQYKQVIYKVCYVYANDSEQLNDLYQDIVINLWKGFPNFRGESKHSTWIYRISLFTCISFIRKDKKRPVIVPLSVNAELLHEDEDKTGMLHELYSMINKLGKLERALILLWLEEKSYNEIAEITGLSRNNVAIKLMRIKDKLKTMYNI